MTLTPRGDRGRAEMDYDTITIDTQTVMGAGFDFDGGLLAQLKQFKNGPVSVVISAMVVGEIVKHFAIQAKLVAEQFDSASRRAAQFGLRARDDRPAERFDPHEFAKLRVERFLKDIGARVIEAGNVATIDLVNRYLDQAAPFSKGKKTEFPDAITLLSLEKWAGENGRYILAVSNDGDWDEFAKSCPKIKVMKSLSDALVRLQGDTARAQAAVERLLQEIDSENATSYEDKLEDALADSIGDYSVEGTGDSRFNVECEFVSLTMQDYQWDQRKPIQVVRFGPNIIVAKMAILARIEAEAQFSLTFEIEDETYNFGHADRNSMDEYPFEVLIEFEGDFDALEVEVNRVDILSGPDTIDFGYLDSELDEEYEE